MFKPHGVNPEEYRYVTSDGWVRVQVTMNQGGRWDAWFYKMMPAQDSGTYHAKNRDYAKLKTAQKVALRAALEKFTEHFNLHEILAVQEFCGD